MPRIAAAKIQHIPASHLAGMDIPRKRHQYDNKCEAHELSAFSAQQRSQHSAPDEFGKAGGAAEDCRPQAAKHAPACGLRAGAEPVRQAIAGLGAFLRDARGSIWRVQRHVEGQTDPESRFSGMRGAKRHLAALLRRTHARNDSPIRSSRPEMTPKPRPSVVCAAKGNGDEGFRAARKGEGFCISLCTSSCIALFRITTKE